jgi:hypothetical protein
MPNLRNHSVFSAENRGGLHQGMEINFSVVHQWTKDVFQKANPIPWASIGGDNLTGETAIRSGECNGKPVKLFDRSGRFFIQVHKYDNDGRVLTIESPGNKETLEKYFNMMYGQITWH